MKHCWRMLCSATRISKDEHPCRAVSAAVPQGDLLRGVSPARPAGLGPSLESALGVPTFDGYGKLSLV
jgi:hypothetical protein